ncbi:MAG TPA: ATP-binding protein [Thermoanaerobaculia bacterium]|nr:ATP-binding protein [Thermoanaerobaculia bacterium]
MNWIEANQRHLTAALREVRGYLERYAEQPAEPVALEPLPELEPPLEPAIDVLCRRFGLSSFERRLLLLCAGVELDSSVAALCAAAQANNVRQPTFSLALAVLPDAHWSALTPDAPLRRWKLIELREASGATLVTAPLAIDERILHFLTGIQHRDTRLAGAVQSIEPAATPLAASHAALAQRMTAAFAGGDGVPVVELCGGDAAEVRAVALHAAESLRLGLLALDGDAVPQNAAELDAFATLLDREASLTASAIYIDALELDPGDGRAVRHVARVAERLSAPLFLGTRDRWRAIRRRVRTFDVGRPARDEQLAAWRAALGPASESMNGELDRIAAQFDLPMTWIRGAAEEALQSCREGVELGAAVWDAGRAAARPQLEALAQRIDVVATRDELVLPRPELRQLDDVASHVAHRTRVYEGWGFSRTSRRGLGISALFAGASGTGKTLAAEVLAGELCLDLYRIDLSSVVNKYIGETEKNLRRVFDGAEGGGAILFFDEADALFGKRAEVRDSHDRYANIEINYLLQRMESYRGLAILATNRKADLDPAFLRRIRFIVNFPFPDQAMRFEIWKRIFPRDVPLEGVDFARLARMNLSGGNIRNVAMSAAFLAAASGENVAMHHVIAAAEREHAKLERPMMEGV